MKIILWSDVKNVGKKYEIVEVRDGYATNYIIPKKLGDQYNAVSQNKLDNILKNKQDEINKQINNALLIKEKLEKINPIFYIKSNGGKYFGHISNKAIIDFLNKDEKIVNKLMLKKHYELEVGNHIIEIHLYNDIIAKIKVTVKDEL